MFIREYICEECGAVQERWLDSSEDENTEKCENCGAKPEKLTKALPNIGKHVSWGKWSV